MHAFLIIDTNHKNRHDDLTRRLNETKISKYDRILLSTHDDKPTIGVSDVRLFIQQLSLSSGGNYGTAGIIEDASRLTEEAQQALLKTIEEPPPHVQLYIGAISETHVLPTIASRCQIIRLFSNESTFTKEEISLCLTCIHELCSISPGKKIQLLQSLGKTRDETKRWIDCAIVATWSTKENISLIHALFEAKRLSIHNVNIFQLLEHIFL